MFVAIAGCVSYAVITTIYSAFYYFVEDLSEPVPLK